jgi:cytochrome c oxidase cbb3-type subunit 2
MSKLVLIAGGSTLIYACLAVLMGVLPGIDQSRVPAGQARALVPYLASLKQPPIPGFDTASSATAAPSATAPGVSSGMAAAATASGANASTQPGYDAAKGRALYTANCSACHQASGEGLPGTFPPLKGSGVVTKDDATKHMRVVLNGLQGEKAGGVVYASPMPPFAAMLSDADIADIIDYERSSWGNNGKPVTAAQVAAERAHSK